MENVENPTHPENGKNLSLEEAQKYIQAFENYQRINDRTFDSAKLGIGQKFDLLKLRNFIHEIDNHVLADKINAVRIYLARSDRDGTIEENYDVVLIPVLDTNEDLHKVYEEDPSIAPLATLLGKSSPCPSVCGGIRLF